MKIIDIASRNLQGLEPQKIKMSLGSRTMFVAAPDDSAYAVARAIDRQPGAFALVLGDDEEPLAVLVPTDVRSALAWQGEAQPESLDDAVRRLFGGEGETGRNLAANVFPLRPSVDWCPIHGHYTTPPCPFL